MGVQPASRPKIVVFSTRGSLNPAKGLIDSMVIEKAKTAKPVAIGLEIFGKEWEHGMPSSFPILLAEYAKQNDIKVVSLHSKALSIKHNALSIAHYFGKDLNLINEICEKVSEKLLKYQQQNTQKKTLALKKELKKAKMEYNFFALVKKFAENPEKIDKALHKIDERQNKILVARILKYRPPVVIVHYEHVERILEALKKKLKHDVEGSYLEPMGVPPRPYHNLEKYLEELSK